MDLNNATWRKSSSSTDNGGNCVELAAYTVAPDCLVAAVRDSKDPEGPALSFPPAEWTEFALKVKASLYDL
jgi:hypothetical protein